MIKAVLYYLIQIFQYLILGRVIMSWISQDYKNPFVRFFYQTTEPMLSPIRQLLIKLGLGGSMFDFSPIAAILLFNILASIVIRL